MKVTSKKILEAMRNTEAGKWAMFIDRLRYDHTTDDLHRHYRVPLSIHFDAKTNDTDQWLIQLRDFLENAALEELMEP